MTNNHNYDYDDGNSKVKIFRGVDARNTRRTSEEEQEEERKAANLQKWQRAKFARELGFKADTTDIKELAAIDKKYEDMLQELKEWNEEQQKISDTRAIALLRLQANEITFEEYEKILIPHKGAFLRNHYLCLIFRRQRRGLI